MTVDLIVVGSGIVGAFIAHEARRLNPNWRIRVLEQHASPASGATGWSVGADFPIAATRAHLPLIAASRERYAALAHTPSGVYMRNIPMFYAVQRDQLSTFRSQMTVPLRIATKDERARVGAMLPGVVLKSGEEFVTHSEQGVIIDARLLTQSLLSSEREQGKTTVETGCHVDGIHQIGDKYLVSAKGREWRAANVALAVGPWDLPGSLSSYLYPVAELRCKRVAALHTRLPIDLGDPLVYFIDDDLFVLPHAKGQALVSFRRNAWDVKPDLLDGHTNEDDIREGLRALAARSPQAARNCSSGQAFCDLYAPNRLPIIRTSPMLPGIVAVQGGSGSGVRLAPGLALQALAALRGARSDRTVRRA